MIERKPALIRWLEYNYLSQDCDEQFSKIRVDTLFIDNNSLYQPIDIEHNPSDKATLMPSTTDQLNEIFYSCVPQETLFFAVDGALPVSRYQTSREKKLGTAIKNKLLKNFQFPNEKTFKNITKEQDPNFFDDSIKDFLTYLQNQSNVPTKKFIYSNSSIPGESTYKYFDFFKRWRNSKEHVKNQNHFIYSNNIETILFSLQFLDENIYIIYPFSEKNTTQYKVIFNKNIHNYFQKRLVHKQIDQNRLFDDIIGLMLIVENSFIPSMRLFKSYHIKHHELFDAYFILNAKKQNGYKFVIENGVFNVSVLKEIIFLMSRMISQQERREAERKEKIEKAKREEKQKMLEEKFGSAPKKASTNNNNTLPTSNQSTNHNSPSPPQHQTQQPNPESYSFPQPQQMQPPQQIRPTSMATTSMATTSMATTSMVTTSMATTSMATTSMATTSTNADTKQPKYTPKVDKPNRNNPLNFDFENSCQELLRILNYSFIYYTQGIPSWNYYFSIKYPPFFGGAVKFMKQENRSFFSTIDKEFPDKLLEILIVLPPYFLTAPWPIYKIKMSQFSTIASKYWNQENTVREVEMFDLNEIKEFYNKALEEMTQDEITLYNNKDGANFILEKEKDEGKDW